MTLANYLYALVYSDVYDDQMWQSWGENLLEDAEYNIDTEWVFNVVLANDKTELFEAISERMNCENYLGYNKYVLTEIIQGYYYYQYINKKIYMYELLNKAGDVADAGEDSLGCEFFYGLLNKIDCFPQLVESSQFIKEVSEYFVPLYREAMGQKQALELATVKDLLLD